MRQLGSSNSRDLDSSFRASSENKKETAEFFLKLSRRSKGIEI